MLQQYWATLKSSRQLRKSEKGIEQKNVEQNTASGEDTRPGDKKQ